MHPPIAYGAFPAFDEGAAEIPLPFTVGMWETTDPIEVQLRAGTNRLRFTREGEVKGVTIKEFVLTPVRSR